VVLWARVSSKEQREKGWSLQEQVRELRDYVAQAGWVVATEYALDESASRSKRTVFNEMLSSVAADLGIAAVVSIRMDRLSRGKPNDVLRLNILRQETGLKIRFVKEQFDETAFGEFVLGLRQSLAGLEIGLMKERIRDGKTGRAREGWYPGKPPYPYVNGKKKNRESLIRLDPQRPQRAALAKRLFDLVAEGVPVDAACAKLGQEGFVYSARDPVIPRESADRLLRHRFHFGEFEWEGVVYQGKHEPFVTPELWQRVQDVLDGRGAGRYGKGTIPYNGLIKCGLCASEGRMASMTCEPVKKRLASGEIKIYGYLRCSMSGKGHGKRGCKVPRLSVPELEQHLGELVERIVFDDDALELVRTALCESHGDHVDRVETALRSFRLQLTKAERRKKRAYTLALDGGLEAPQLRELTDGIDADITRVRGEITRLEGESHAYYEEGIRVIELAQRLHEVWLRQDSALKREIIDCLVLNCTWDGVSLSPEWRRPFNLLVERPSPSLHTAGGI
tara:strand:+ start:2817 stop:4337 length:1521 start_codon:yes stop_codon:yes gene_type:complete